jgi:hypothetical protein
MNIHPRAFVYLFTATCFCLLIYGHVLLFTVLVRHGAVRAEGVPRGPQQSGPGEPESAVADQPAILESQRRTGEQSEGKIRN